MCAERSGRRAFALGAASLLLGRQAAGRGRTALGGRVSLRVPWPLFAIDPHDPSSAAAALFGDALFDTLYVRDEVGGFVPGLAEGEPEPGGQELHVRVRAGLRTGRGRPLGAQECVASIARARASGARGWLTEVPVPRASGSTLRFATKDPSRLVRALASPLVAIVPRGFSPETPDGTGPFRFQSRGDALILARNPLAARGPAFLDELVLRSSADLKASLRAFESGADDLGWLGLGLYEIRAGARPFDAGVTAFATLFVGRDAGAWDAPGVAQRICDSVPAARLAEFALGAPWRLEPSDGWGGPPSSILVRDDAPYLLELARALAGVLSRPGHELVTRAVPPEELASRKISRLFALALDAVRPASHGSFGALVGLTTAVDPARAAELVRHPPKLGEVSVRALTRTLRCGVLGEIRAQGGRVADVNVALSSAAPGVDWGAVSRGRRG